MLLPIKRDKNTSPWNTRNITSTDLPSQNCALTFVYRQVAYSTSSKSKVLHIDKNSHIQYIPLPCISCCINHKWMCLSFTLGSWFHLPDNRCELENWARKCLPFVEMRLEYQQAFGALFSKVLHIWLLYIESSIWRVTGPFVCIGLLFFSRMYC